jgi:hypothetical protein
LEKCNYGLKKYGTNALETIAVIMTIYNGICCKIAKKIKDFEKNNCGTI